jgi:hypothetical protein
MSAIILPFPRHPRREPQVEVTHERDGGDGWLVVGPRGYGELYASLDVALADAKQIAASHGIDFVRLAEAVIKIEAAS